jgi:glycosyltransferase involved in cell wall biosynthesis
VIIPCRNMGRYVVDDASDDGTTELLSELGSRIVLVRGPGQGSATARNLGLLAATGDWFAFLDADDVWYPDKLQRQFQAIAARGADASYTDYRRGPEPSRAGPPMLAGTSLACDGQIFSALLRTNFLLTSTVVIHRDLIARCGLFKPELRGGQDIDLWLRIARIANFARVDEPLTFYRQHGGNITLSDMYSYYHAQRWEAVYREHADIAPSEREYIRQRWHRALHAAARKAWWRNDFELARRCFGELRAAGGGNAATLLWQGVLLLPDSWLRLARSGKQRFSSVDDDRPTEPGVVGLGVSARR